MMRLAFVLLMLAAVGVLAAWAVSGPTPDDASLGPSTP
jgi:hypothetical protein